MKSAKRIFFFIILDILFFIVYYLFNMAGNTFSQMLNWGDVSYPVDIAATVFSYIGFYVIFILESTDRKKHGLKMIAEQTFPSEKDIWNPIKTIRSGNYDLLIYMAMSLPLGISYFFAPFSFGKNTITAEIFFPFNLLFKIISIPVVAFIVSCTVFYLVQSVSRMLSVRKWKQSELSDKEKELLTEEGRIDYRL